MVSPLSGLLRDWFAGAKPAPPTAARRVAGRTPAIMWPYYSLGAWGLGLGAWGLGLGAWGLGRGAWCVARGAWRLALGAGRLALGAWLLAIDSRRATCYVRERAL